MTAQSLWTCGTLGKAHGLRGELYLNLTPGGLRYLELGERFCLGPAAPVRDGTGGGAAGLTPCTVTRAGGTDRRPLVLLDLASSREAAVALQGRELLAAGEALESLPHYRVGDLVGRPVTTVSGRLLGEVRDVMQAPAHEVLEIRTASGASLLVPLVDEVVTLDEAAGTLLVVDGLLEE